MKNVLIIHDISGYGKCSTTVALPILSSMELTGTLLPSALLSTHTGPGFEGFTFLDLKDEMPKITDHWKSFGLKFDAIYIGYLGHVAQIEFLSQELPALLADNGKIYLDPVMADNGQFYPGFDQNYAHAMRDLCRIADVVMPNQTEAAYLFDLDYKEGLWPEEKIQELEHALGQYTEAALVLTGAGFDEQGKTGAYFKDPVSDQSGLVQADFVGGSFHGTGDIFGSILVGASVNGADLAEATRIAVETLPKIIKISLDDPNMEQNGLQFERFLGDLSQYVRELKK
ncbi:pyridoxamine kinase [Aerococcus kribbianus]|uniref:pyridoxal kinase n=1 Tax=Aerococcus kribbianus TaxID=2999064 RepID=A0A9X3FM94_9LACT|nr:MULTISPECIES: pyridoxamine kinase [unclassified Aerococcus]MCZ0717090.1 pyridoxamine kinase [Aerococcus sp. YH-aer221]MCZ0725378.1 pyridoxamine kinase [Aerococcus sp. YH-aer222]